MTQTDTAERPQPPGTKLGETMKPPFGIIGLDLGFEPVPGMVTHPASFPTPVVYANLEAPRLIERILDGDASLYEDIHSLGRQLVDQGVHAVGTSCGYFSAYQDRLAADLTVPVLTSPLLQIPTILATLSPPEKIGVVWASVNPLVGPALAGAGVDPSTQRLAHQAMDGPGIFRDAILARTAPLDSPALEEQIVNTCQAMVTDNPDLGALLLECGDLSAYAHAVRSATGKPVYDYLTFFGWANASIT